MSCLLDLLSTAYVSPHFLLIVVPCCCVSCCVLVRWLFRPLVRTEKQWLKQYTAKAKAQVFFQVKQMQYHTNSIGLAIAGSRSRQRLALHIYMTAMTSMRMLIVFDMGSRSRAGAAAARSRTELAALRATSLNHRFLGFHGLEVAFGKRSTVE